MAKLFVDQLTVIDFSYLDASRGLLGESWIVDCELSGELNEEGMVFDFGHVKKAIKQFIDDFADHKLLIAEQTPGLTIERDSGHNTLIDWKNEARFLKTSAPCDAFLFINAPSIDQETLASLLESELKNILPDNVSGVSLHLYPEIIQGSYYHYSHGLKKHDGNCQRIAHGHRSPIEVFVDDHRSDSLEQEWAETFKDIYIGTREDLDTSINTAANAMSFKYQAPQGEFTLSMNQDQVYLIDTDSTVEWIADHIAKSIHQKMPNSRIKVKAFEGYRKGAIAEY